MCIRDSPVSGGGLSHRHFFGAGVGLGQPVCLSGSRALWPAGLCRFFQRRRGAVRAHRRVLVHLPGDGLGDFGVLPPVPGDHPLGSGAFAVPAFVLWGRLVVVYGLVKGGTKGNPGFLCAALCASGCLQGGFCSGAGAADEETVGSGEILKMSKTIDIFPEIPYTQSVKSI